MQHDPVNAPRHYTQGEIECIEVTEKLSFCLGNAVKYCWRHEDKNGSEDLQKALWYIKREKERVEQLSWLGRWIWRRQVQKAWNLKGKPYLVCNMLYPILLGDFAQAYMEVTIALDSSAKEYNHVEI